MEQKAMAPALLWAKGQKKKARRDAKKQVAVWTTIGFERLVLDISVGC